MFFKPQHLHFTGIGGIGMTGIAEVLLNLGYEISGSDLKLSPTTERLTEPGRPHLRRSRRGEHRRRQGGGGQLRGRYAQSRSAGSAAPEHPGDPARRTAGRADAPEVRDRDRRQPRQNHDHFDDRGDPERSRAGPHGGGGRQSRRPWAAPTRAWAAAISWWWNPTRATARF